jgi:hypothetical protein
MGRNVLVSAVKWASGRQRNGNSPRTHLENTRTCTPLESHICLLVLIIMDRLAWLLTYLGGNLFLVPRGLSLQARFISISTAFCARLHVQAVFVDRAFGLRVRRRMISSGTLVIAALFVKRGVTYCNCGPFVTHTDSTVRISISRLH